MVYGSVVYKEPMNNFQILVLQNYDGLIVCVLNESFCYQIVTNELVKYRNMQILEKYSCEKMKVKKKSTRV